MNEFYTPLLTSTLVLHGSGAMVCIDQFEKFMNEVKGQLRTIETDNSGLAELVYRQNTEMSKVRENEKAMIETNESMKGLGEQMMDMDKRHQERAQCEQMMMDTVKSMEENMRQNDKVQANQMAELFKAISKTSIYMEEEKILRNEKDKREYEHKGTSRSSKAPQEDPLAGSGGWDPWSKTGYDYEEDANDEEYIRKEYEHPSKSYRSWESYGYGYNNQQWCGKRGKSD